MLKCSTLEEAKQKYSEIWQAIPETAKDFPDMGRILGKLENGIPLTKNEIIRRKTFFKECELRVPRYQKIAGEEYHRILVERGLKRK